LKFKFLYIGILFIIVSSIGNYLYFYSEQLDEPIVLKHHYLKMFDPNSNLEFDLYYIVNKKDPKSIQHVSVDEVYGYVVNHSPIFWGDGVPSIQYAHEYPHQYLMKATIEFIPETLPLMDENVDTWSFDHMNITFSNGKTVDVNIGKIVFKRLNSSKASNVLDFRYTSSSSNGEENTAFVINEDAILENTDIPYFEHLNEYIDLSIRTDSEKIKEESESAIKDVPKIEGTNKLEVENTSLPIQLKKADWIQFQTKIKRDLLSPIEIDALISGKTEKGEPFSYSIPISYMPNYNDLQSLIEERGH